MPLIAADLAEAIRSAMAFPSPVSAQLVAWATGIILEIQTKCTVSNLPGTVFGVVPPSGGPLIAGGASAGLMSGMTGSSASSFIVASDPIDYPFATPQLMNFCEGIVQHIQTVGQVTFSVGTINGACTNTLITPGVFTGVGTNGQIINLNGPAMATLVASLVPFPGPTPQLIAKCTAIANYIMANAQVNYSTVTGACSAGGGALIAGTASGGLIS